MPIQWKRTKKRHGCSR